MSKQSLRAAAWVRHQPDPGTFVSALKALGGALSARLLFPLSALYLDSFIFASNAAK